MHVLYIHQHFSTPKGCGGTRSYEMAKALIAAGHTVTMVCGANQLSNTGIDTEYVKGIRRGEFEGIQIVEVCVPYSNYDGFFARSLKFFKFALKTVSVVAHAPCDLVYATSTPLTVAIPALFAKWFKKKKMIFEVRDLWPELPKAMGVVKNPILLWLLDKLETLAYRNADHCVGLSPGMCEGINKKLPEDRQAMLIPNGCDIDFFQSGKKDRALLERYGIADEDFVVVFSGAHGMANGLNAVLEAAKVVMDSGNASIKFLFIGDGKLKPDLQKQAKALQLSNCIFVDPIPKEQLKNILRTVDAGLMVLKNISAFYYGTSPNKFFDYLSCGLPILTNYPGWVADLVAKHHCGVAVKPDDSNAFAQAIIALSNMQEDERIEQGNNALLLAEQSFMRADLVKKCVRLCEKVMLG